MGQHNILLLFKKLVKMLDSPQFEHLVLSPSSVKILSTTCAHNFHLTCVNCETVKNQR